MTTIISMAKGVDRDSGREILIHEHFTHRLNQNNTLLHFYKIYEMRFIDLQ